MTNAILAGMMIGFGAIINLTLEGITGAIFFSFGLFTILNFDYSLFTGKAGLLATKEIKIQNLVIIWIGNFIGTIILTVLVYRVPIGSICTQNAHNIVLTRIQNGFLMNMILGILCGILMYIAVTGYKKIKNPLFVVAPVTIFILCGFNHCIADMFYLNIGTTDLKDYLVLIPTTIGNILGCNLIPCCQKKIHLKK